MTTKHLFSLARRSHKPSYSFTAARSSSSAASSLAATESKEISPPPPTAMIYDRLALDVKSKLQKLENPDPRFLKYGSPHPTLTSHTHILSSPETKITTTSSNGLRVATESTISSRTAMVGVWIDAGSRFQTEETNGTAHFLEGTERRSARELEEEPDCLDDLAFATMHETTKLAYRVSEADVIRACNQLKSSLMLHIDRTSPVAEDIGRQLLTYGRRITKEHLQNYIQTHYTALRMHQRHLYSSVASSFYTLHTDASVSNDFPDSTAGAVFRDTQGSVIWFKSTILADVDATHIAEFYSLLIGVRLAILTLIVRRVKNATLVAHVGRLDVYDTVTSGVIPNWLDRPFLQKTLSDFLEYVKNSGINVKFKRVDREYNQDADNMAKIVLQMHVEEKLKSVASVDCYPEAEGFTCHIYKAEVKPYFCGDIIEIVLIDRY